MASQHLPVGNKALMLRCKRPLRTKKNSLIR